MVCVATILITETRINTRRNFGMVDHHNVEPFVGELTLIAIKTEGMNEQVVRLGATFQT